MSFIDKFDGVLYTFFEFVCYTQPKKVCVYNLVRNILVNVFIQCSPYPYSNHCLIVLKFQPATTAIRGVEIAIMGWVKV